MKRARISYTYGKSGSALEKLAKVGKYGIVAHGALGAASGAALGSKFGRIAGGTKGRIVGGIVGGAVAGVGGAVEYAVARAIARGTLGRQHVSAARPMRAGSKVISRPLTGDYLAQHGLQHGRGGKFARRG